MLIKNPFTLICLLLCLVSTAWAEKTRRVPFDSNWVEADQGLGPNGDAQGYRKSFMVPIDAADRKVYIDFDSIELRAKVYINGELAGEWGQGYNSFRIDATSHLAFGEDNTIEVEIDSGELLPCSEDVIRGHVWMIDAPEIHIAHWGTYVTTPEVSAVQALVDVETTIDNGSGRAARVLVRNEIFDRGQLVASGEKWIVVHRTASSQKQLMVIDPKRWDENNRHLYIMRTSLLVNGKLVDQKDTPFGIRRSDWEA